MNKKELKILRIFNLIDCYSNNQLLEIIKTFCESRKNIWEDKDEFYYYISYFSDEEFKIYNKNKVINKDIKNKITNYLYRLEDKKYIKIDNLRKDNFYITSKGRDYVNNPIVNILQNKILIWISITYMIINILKILFIDFLKI